MAHTTYNYRANCYHCGTPRTSHLHNAYGKCDPCNRLEALITGTRAKCKFAPTEANLALKQLLVDTLRVRRFIKIRRPTYLALEAG